jgi:cytochrome c oxidase subunit 4
MDMQMDHYHQHTYVPGQTIEKPQTKWIWKVFWILLAVTAVEVTFAFMNDGGNGTKNYLPAVGEKWLFISLTLVKAFYIVFHFMHLKDEKFNFKLTIALTTTFLVYFIALMMYEGYSLRDTQMIRPDFFHRIYHGEHGGAAHDAAAAHGATEHGASEHKEESHH